MQWEIGERSSGQPAKPPGQREHVHDFLFARALTDIVYQQRQTLRAALVRDNADMIEVAWQFQSDQIARIERRRNPVGESGTFAAQKNLQIADPPVVDVGVGACEPPAAGVVAKRGAHVGIHERLQVEPEGVAVGADDDVGADAALARDVTAGKGKLDIGRVLNESDTDLRAGGGDKGSCGHLSRQHRSGPCRNRNSRSTQDDIATANHILSYLSAG